MSKGSWKSVSIQTKCVSLLFRFLELQRAEVDFVCVSQLFPEGQCSQTYRRAGYPRPCRAVVGMEISSFPKGSDLCFLLQGAGCQGRGCWAGVMLPFFSKCVPLCRESYSFPILALIPYRIKWESSEQGIKSVCLVSYMPVKSSWLKAIILHFCSPFPDYCWFCDFCLVWGFDYFILF